ncbi:MAG: Replication-associated recombination protein RarA, partial [uncultured Gemmatimonadetes bacterium]
ERFARHVRRRPAQASRPPRRARPRRPARRAHAAAHPGRDRRPAAPGGPRRHAAQAAGGRAPAEPDPARPSRQWQDDAGARDRRGRGRRLRPLQRGQRGRAAAAGGGEGGRGAAQGGGRHAPLRGRDPPAEQGAAGFPPPVDGKRAGDAGGRHHRAPGVRDQSRAPLALPGARPAPAERRRRAGRAPPRPRGPGARAGRTAGAGRRGGGPHRPHLRRRRAAGAQRAGDGGAAGARWVDHGRGRPRGAAAADGALRRHPGVRDALRLPQVAPLVRRLGRAVLGHAHAERRRGPAHPLPPPRRRRVRGRGPRGPAGGDRGHAGDAGVRAAGAPGGAPPPLQRHPVRRQRAQVQPRVRGPARRYRRREGAPRRPRPPAPAQRDYEADARVGLRGGLQVRPRLRGRLHPAAVPPRRDRRRALLRAVGPGLRGQDRRAHAGARRRGL